ncbi:SAM-dependent methyltransferase [Peterkaempfera sp. SMS 1(5)a]|uniref:SAM-dependent methyltransferase n=1 Tax=Peterkaempfera podocarpi TaxID=3232308 RepID=UPI00366A5DC0
MDAGDAAVTRWLSSSGRLDPVQPVELRTDRPHSARMYDFLLGGRTNFPADRAVAEQALTAYPGLRTVTRMNRAFMGAAVGRLADLGIRQFLDIGSGIPTTPNVHEIAQSRIPSARIVYTDNDPLVLAHARALLASATGGGRVDYIEADLRHPDRILGHPCLTGPDPALDLTQPVALLLIAVLHFVPDTDDPCRLVKELLEPLAPGSCLVVSHATADVNPEQVNQGARTYRASGVSFQPRNRTEVTRFADGLEVLPPGVAVATKWWPAFAEGTVVPYADDPFVNDAYLLVARKP